jgi:CHASE2 domain-containing sensor protein
MSARLLTLFTRTLYSLGFLSREFRGRFYTGLAAVFTLYTIIHFSPQILEGYSADRLDYDGGTLDLALEWRLSSPAASDDIVIVDIDERSLALLAEDYGRWPWPRSVMGDFLALLSEHEPAAIGVNVMYSDADLNDPDGDALLGEIIGYLPNVTFPMTRLSPENDSLSEVVVGQIPGAVVADEQDPQRTLALLYTLFPEAHANMGLNNLVLDDDGVVRRQQPQWLDDGFTLPSMAYQMARLGGAITADAPALHPEYLLNWRNKQNDYTRLSFVDVYNALLEGQEAVTADLAGKFIVVGLTAPGLAVLKGTALGPATDDNLIIATALDDLLSETGLLTLPWWLTMALAIATFWGLAWCYLNGVDEELIDLGFVVYESIAVFITIGSISFTRYAVDLSYVVLTAMAFFTVAFVYEMPATGSKRATRRFFASRPWLSTSRICAIAFYDLDDDFETASGVFQKRFGAKRVYPIDNLFSGASIAADFLEPVRLLLLLDPADDDADLQALDARHGITVSYISNVTDEDAIRSAISQVALQASLDLLEEVQGGDVE